MKQQLLLFYITILCSLNLVAQSVAINNDASLPNASALLDIKSNSKGLLIPRMSTTDRIAIPVDATTDGLIVYDTDIKSFFYHNTTDWVQVSTGDASNNYWTLSGNDIANNNTGNVGIGISALATSEKFQVDANIKIGRTQWTSGNDRLIKFGDGDFVTIGEAGADDRMVLNASTFNFTPNPGYTGYIGINTTTPTSPLSFGNFIGDKIDLWHTDATHNYGIGVQGGLLQIHSNVTGSDIAFGSGSSASFTETARIFGNGGVQTQGVNAGFWFKDRTLNTYAGWNWYADNGKAHLFKYGLGDVLTIDQTGNVGIGVPSPVVKLDVFGNFKLMNGSADVAAVLTSTDNLGNTRWQLPASYKTACDVNTTSFVSQSNDYVVIPFNTENYDDGNNFDATTTHSYIAPDDGVYHFDVNVSWVLTSVLSQYKIRLTLGNFLGTHDATSYYIIEPNTSGPFSTSISTNFKLLAGQKIPLTVYQSSGANQATTDFYTSFKAYRIY